MTRIAIEDFDGKLPNLAAMKISAYHKALGDEVVLNPSSPSGFDKAYISVLFTKNKEKAEDLANMYPSYEIGGTGYSLHKNLPDEIESMSPDYNLYKTEDIFKRISGRVGKKENILVKAQEIADAGVAFLSRGCINTEKICPWCAVPVKEGSLRRVASISESLNPRSNKLILLDNSLLANPDALDILQELIDRKITVDITQGFDIRRLTPDLALKLSQVRHWRSLHYSWDIVKSEQSIFNGIRTLSEFVSKSRQMCYLLCGFNTEFPEDMERVKRLHAEGVRPYVMLYQPLEDFQNSSAKTDYAKVRLSHFRRWINAPAALYKTVPFAEYSNWMKAQAKLPGAVGATQQELVFA